MIITIIIITKIKLAHVELLNRYKIYMYVDNLDYLLGKSAKHHKNSPISLDRLDKVRRLGEEAGCLVFGIARGA